MAARSLWLKTISLLVIFVFASANITMVRAQDGTGDTPTQTPPVETATAAPATATPLPPTQVEASPTPAAEAATQAATPAPASFSISGTVSGADGQGLTGVTVSDDHGHTVQTAADGSYTLDGLAPGDYQVAPGKTSVALIPYFRVVHLLDKNASGIDFYPRKEPLPDNAAAQPSPANHAPALSAGGASSLLEGGLSAQSAYTAGQPGVAYSLLPKAYQIGATGQPYPLDPPAAITHLNAPAALAVDSAGDMLEVEEHGNRLVRFTNGYISNLVIGDKPGISYMDNYVFNSLTAVGVQPVSGSPTGYYWVGDATRLVQYDPGQPADQRFLQQVPATNPWESGSDNSHFSEIRGIAFNTAGTVMYVSDRFNNRVQMYSLATPKAAPVYQGTITGVTNSDNSPFNQPWGITYYDDGSGHPYLYVADSQNQRIQRCTPDGSSCATFLDDSTTLVVGQQVYLKRPTAISFMGGMAYITDAQNEIAVKCAMSGQLLCNLLVGTAGEAGSDSAHFNWPVAVAASVGFVYMADQNNQRIQLFRLSDHLLIPPIGTTGTPFVADATHVDRPWGIAIDPADDSLYVGENWGYSLAKFDSQGNFLWRVPADAGTFGSDLHHLGSFQGGSQGNLAVDAHHRIYVPDPGNGRVMIYQSDGTVFGQLGSTANPLACPQGVAAGADGKLYVTEPCNQVVQVFDAAQNLVTTIGMTGQAGTDGSHFNQPVAVSIDNSTGDLYIADQANDRVQKCHPTSATSYTCTPFAGSTGVSGNLNFRYLNAPSSVIVDPLNKRVIVAEDQASRVQVFDMHGAYLTTLGGEWGDAGGRMRNPSGLAVSSTGYLYVADRENARVQGYTTLGHSFTQLNVNGFGEQFNGRVEGLTYFSVPYQGTPTSMLYVDTARSDGNPPLPGAAINSPQVWRQLPDATWQAVSAPGFGDPANSGLVDMAIYHNALYVGTYNPNGAQLWRCPNTSPCEKQADWTQVSLPASANTSTQHDTIAARMVVFHDLLAVSLMSYYDNGGMTPGVMATDGGQLWLYDDSTNTWLPNPLTLDAATSGRALVGIQSLAVSYTVLLAGTNDWLHTPIVPAQEWECIWTSGNCAWSRVVDFNLVNPFVSAITSLLVLDGNVYVGTTGANHTGASLYYYSSSGLDNKQLVSGGFGDTNNSAIRAMIYKSPYLIAVTSNDQDGLNIYYSSDNGTTWNPYMNHAGFGNGTNTQVDLDSSITFDPGGRLLVGTWNPVNGGALWASNQTVGNISGAVTNKTSGLGLDGVQMTLLPGGQHTTTAAGGNYTFYMVLPGSYTVTPSLAYYAFTPPSQVVKVVAGSVSGVNFTGVSGAVLLQSPANGTQFASLDPVVLQWATNGTATKYTLQVSTVKDFKTLFKTVTVSGLTYALSGLKTNTTYYWQVRQAAPTPVGAWSAYWSFTTPVPPAAPALLLPASGAALPAGTFKPAFTWKAATVPTGSAPLQHYHIQVSRLSTFATLDIDEYTLDATPSFAALFDLTGNRTYSWRVRAFNTVGDFGLWSSVRTFKTLPQAVASAYMYETITPHYSLTLQPAFHWSDPACTGKYLLQIYNKSLPSHPLVKSATVVTGAACAGDYALTSSLGFNTLYEWHISAVGASGTSLPLIDTFTSPGVVPGVPVLVGPANNEAIPDATYLTWQPAFTWQPVTSGSPGGYQIQIASQPTFGTSTFIDEWLHGADTTSYTPGNALGYNTSVYWRLRACQETCSLWSASRKLVTRPGTPTNLSMSGETLDATFTWSDPGNNPASGFAVANSYSVAIYSNITCTTAWKTLTSATSSAHILLNPGVNYCVKVRGVGPSASITGAYSAPLTFTAITPPTAPGLSAPADKTVIKGDGTIFSEPYTVNFSWLPASGASVYDLQVSEYPDFSVLWGLNNGLTSTTVTNYYASGKYYWRVRSGAGTAYSQWSPVRTFTTLGQIIGTVVDDHGNGLASVQVTAGGGTTPSTTSSGGHFYLYNLPAGAQNLTLSETGWLTQTRTLTVANGGYYTENFEMAQPQTTTLGVFRIVLTWNADNLRALEGNLWLPQGQPNTFHLVYPNVGKSDLTAIPYAMESMRIPSKGLEVIDVKPVSGNYVFGVNQLSPPGASWSGASAKVEVYSGSTWVKTCLQPSGSGSWWYAFDLNGASVTCKNSMRTTAPGPYSDLPVNGYVTSQISHHPLNGVTIKYDTGSVITDSNGFYSIPGISSGSIKVIPQTNTFCQSFQPANQTVSPDSIGIDFTAAQPASLSPGQVYTEAFQGDYAYLGAGSWLYIVDMHNKSSPQEVSRLWIEQNTIQDIVVSGAYAYLASSGNGNTDVNVVNVSDPAHPQWVGSEPVWAANMAVYGQYLVLSSDRYVYVYQQASAASPNTIIRLATIDLGQPYTAQFVAVSGHYAYITGEYGLYIYDLSDPAHPAGPWHYPSQDYYFTAVVVEGQYAYMTGNIFNSGTVILNVADPAHVYQVSTAPVFGTRLAKAGNYLYVAAYASGLTILDVSDPANPVQRGSYAISSETQDVAVQENYAGVLIDADYGYGSEMEILDVSNVDNPAPIGVYIPAP